MQTHLAKGCQTCTAVHDTWQAIRELAESESRYEPPESAVRLAESIFELRRPVGVFAHEIGPAQLLFDSQQSEAPAGMRNLMWGGEPRKLLYAVGDLLVDVQVERARELQPTVLVGQVIARTELQQRLEDIRVLLYRGVHAVARSTPNALGEFQMEFNGPGDHLFLALGFGETGAVVPLGTVARLPS